MISPTPSHQAHEPDCWYAQLISPQRMCQQQLSRLCLWPGSIVFDLGPFLGTGTLQPTHVLCSVMPTCLPRFCGQVFLHFLPSDELRVIITLIVLWAAGKWHQRPNRQCWKSLQSHFLPISHAGVDLQKVILMTSACVYVLSFSRKSL